MAWCSKPGRGHGALALSRSRALALSRRGAMDMPKRLPTPRPPSETRRGSPPDRRRGATSRARPGTHRPDDGYPVVALLAAALGGPGRPGRLRRTDAQTHRRTDAQTHRRKRRARPLHCNWWGIGYRVPLSGHPSSRPACESAAMPYQPRIVHHPRYSYFEIQLLS